MQNLRTKFCRSEIKGVKGLNKQNPWNEW